MENIIQMLIPLIIVILTFVLGNSRRRREQQGRAEREQEENAMPEGEAAPPPFMEDFPFETRLEDMILQQNEVEESPVVEEPVPVPEPEPVEPSQPVPPTVPVQSPAGIRTVPATSLLDLSPRTFRQGIILREILGRPRSLRRGAPFRDRQDR